MKLSRLLERVTYTRLQGVLDVEVTDVVNDSRKVTRGSLFICIKGAVTDGHQYAADVIKKRSQCAGGGGSH